MQPCLLSTQNVHSSKSSGSTPMNCGICDKPIQNDDMNLPCCTEHFHGECLAAWSRSRPSRSRCHQRCPICQHPLSETLVAVAAVHTCPMGKKGIMVEKIILYIDFNVPLSRNRKLSPETNEAIRRYVSALEQSGEAEEKQIIVRLLRN